MFQHLSLHIHFPAFKPSYTLLEHLNLHIQGVPKKTEFQKFSDVMIFYYSGPSEQFWAPWPYWAILGPQGHSGPSGPFWVLWASVEQLLCSYMNANANREDARFNFYCIYASRHTTKILCTQVKWNEAGAVTYRLLQPLPLSKDTDTICLISF